MNYNKFRFAEQLKSYKEDSRFSYSSLAERSGIPEQTLKRWILEACPNQPPDRERLFSLAAALELNKEQAITLLDLADCPYPSNEELNKLVKQQGNEQVKWVLQKWISKVMTIDEKIASPAQAGEAMGPGELREDTAFILESPEGAMAPESPFYVERPEDKIVREQIKRQGITITIIGPGQVGKSSMLNQIIPEAIQVGKRVILLNFQLFDQPTLANTDTFFHQFCTWLTDELEMESRTEQYWQALNNIQRCTRYMSLYLLRQLNCPLVLMMDRVETIFDTAFGTDFFGMLRSWHDSRGIPTQPIWKQLDLVLATSTEPFQFIKNVNLSPFNVGAVVQLVDFTLDQIADLNRRHRSPLTSQEVQNLMDLVAGHPYLTRRALYLVADQRMTPTELFDRSTDDDGPFSLHLQRHLRRLQNLPEQQAALRKVIQHHKLSDVPMFFRLQGAGLVRREKNDIVPRCKLYANYFGGRL